MYGIYPYKSRVAKLAKLEARGRQTEVFLVQPAFKRRVGRGIVKTHLTTGFPIITLSCLESISGNCNVALDIEEIV